MLYGLVEVQPGYHSSLYLGCFCIINSGTLHVAATLAVDL